MRGGHSDQAASPDAVIWNDRALLGPLAMPDERRFSSQESAFFGSERWKYIRNNVSDLLSLCTAIVNFSLKQPMIFEY